MTVAPVQGNSLKIKYRIVPYTRGRGLDLACGVAKTWPHFIGVDNYLDWNGRINHPEIEPAVRFSLRMSIDVVEDAFDLKIISGASMDFVLASHILDLARKPKDALREWWRVIKQGGYLILYGPCGEENIDAQVMGYMTANAGGFDLIESERCEKGYVFFQVYRKRHDRQQVMVFQDPKPAKTCAVVRYGAFGDMIQATSILTHLKAEGYHITMFTHARGYEVIQHDPRIDAFVIQDHDQVPNEELGKYHDYWATRFDRFISLCEAMEATLLRLPPMVTYHWPQPARNMICNVDYLELLHAIADVPGPPDPKFYPTAKEMAWARRERDRIPGKVAVWVSDGSSVHKYWPYMDNAIARILTTSPDWHVFIVGGDMGQMLEAGWENEPRVHKTCGRWGIRETITFATMADLVIGPETGVMNAVAMLDVAKIVFLSHSTENNLTKCWRNTFSLSAKDGCKSCHKLIYGWSQCNRVSKKLAVGDKTMVIEGAECQVNIGLDDFWDAFLRVQNIKKAA
jgi:ADP-heptose:LPS heptosyltransferase